MRIGTLFSGIGAPEQGAKRVYDDLEMVFACEYEKFARESFNANYEIHEDHFHIDVNDMDGTQYKDKVDIIIGGSPCQAFSIAGLREGLNDKRGQLIWQYYRIIMEAQPEIFIYENVKGMVSDNNGNTLKDFLDVFRESGYYCHHAVLNTKDYGVPQNRERVYIVGFKDHELYHRFQFAPKIKLEKRLKDVLESDVDEKYYISDDFIESSLIHKNRHQERGNGFAFEPKTEDEICGCISTKYGNRQTDTYLKVKSATKAGYETATTGDSINLTHPDSKTRRIGIGVGVGVGVAQTLDCACNQATIIKGDKDEKNTSKTLSEVWKRNVAKTIQQWKNGGGDRVYAEEVLLKGLRESSISFGNRQKGEALQFESFNIENDSEIQSEYELLRTMWNGWKNGYSSRRRELGEQSKRKLDGIVQKLSSENAQTETNMQNKELQLDSERIRILREALSEIQKMGQPIQSETSEKYDYRIRKLTERECLRLQDFPESFKQVVSSSQQYKQAGNSMSVNILEMIFRQIEKAKENEPTNTLMDFIS